MSLILTIEPCITRYSYNTIKKLPPYNAIWENNSSLFSKFVQTHLPRYTGSCCILSLTYSTTISFISINIWDQNHMYTSWRVLRSQAFPFNRELVHTVKMMSRLQLGLWSGRGFFPTQSIRSRSSHEDRGRRAPEGRRGDWGAAPRWTSVSITCHRLSDEQRRFTRAHFARYYAKRAEDSSLLRSCSSRRAFCAAINLCYAPRERCAWK